MRYTHTKGFIDRESYVVQYLALAIFTVGVTSTIGCDDLLAAFAAGAPLNLVHSSRRPEQNHRQCNIMG